MKRSLPLRFVVLSSLAALSCVALAQGSPEVNARIVKIGKEQNQIMKTLKDLCDIGPRLSGSRKLDQAIDWSMRQFRSYGLTDVRLEKFADWPVRFDRGDRQSARMISPWNRTFEFTSYAWTPGTDGPTRGAAVLAPTSMEQFEDMKEQLRGAWVIFPEAPPRGANRADLDAAINGAGILGRVTGSRNEQVMTHGNFNIQWDALPTTRTILVRKSDMDDIMAGIRAGRDVVLEFDMEQKMSPGPVPMSNVIAEIKGTEKPDEIVIVSAHIDSWDGPGTQGANDNATGVGVVLESARILMAAGAKPKRTIQFVLWNGEEQGLFGSRRYVEMHADKLDKISAVFVEDGGTNYQGGLTCTKEMEAMLRQALSPMDGVFPDMPFTFNVVDTMPRGGGSDHAPFNNVGVPGFYWREVGRFDYGSIYHAQHDTYDTLIPEYMVQSATNTAVMAYNLACADTLLPRSAPPAATGGSGRGGGK